MPLGQVIDILKCDGLMDPTMSKDSYVRDCPLAQAIFFLQAGPMMVRAYCSPLI